MEAVKEPLSGKTTLPTDWVKEAKDALPEERMIQGQNLYPEGRRGHKDCGRGSALSGKDATGKTSPNGLAKDALKALPGKDAGIGV